MKGYISIVVFLLFSFLAKGQPDSTYIKPFPEKFAIQGTIEKKLLVLTDEYKNSDSKVYTPNNPVDLGVGLSINNTIISVGYGYGFDFMRDKERGKTESFDFQLHNFGQKYVFDIFIQKYKGFYMEEGDNHSKFELCPDLQITRYGASVQYVFNGNRFSYKAAFNQSEEQLKPAGSFILGVAAYHTVISSDSSLIINEQNKLKNFQFGISAGYAYTWVINKRYFVSTSATAGVNIGNESIDRIGKDRLEVYPTVFPRISAGYNKEKWSLGFSFQGNLTFPTIKDERSISIFSGNFQLRYTRRLDYIPILSKIFK